MPKNHNQTYNEIVKQELETNLGKRLREIDWTRISKAFKCTAEGCKEFLPSPILNFYGYDVSKAFCYACQHKQEGRKNFIGKFDNIMKKG